MGRSISRLQNCIFEGGGQPSVWPDWAIFENSLCQIFLLKAAQMYGDFLGVL